MTDSASQTLLSAIQDLSPVILKDAAAAEERGQLSSAVVGGMKACGVFRMFVPRDYGGLELDLPDIVQAVRSLARLEGSVGWAALVGNVTTLGATTLPRDMFESIYSSSSQAILAGSVQTLGVVTQSGRSWHASGRWPLASLSGHADWMLGFCKLAAGDAGAKPGVAIVVLPALRWTVEPTWRNAPGLKATGSNHISLDSPVTPEVDFCDPTKQQSWVTGPLYGRLQQTVPLLHAAVSLGIAEGALDDILTIANRGTQRENTVAQMRESEAFRADLGGVHADIRAAQTLLAAQAARHWQQACSTGLELASDVLLAEASQVAAWTVQTCLRAVGRCFALGGTAALYGDTPLGRRLRDIHVAAQHSAVQPRNYARTGKLLMA